MGSIPGQLDYCGHCGAWHQGQCPRIKSIEYWPDGTIKKVEYHDLQAKSMNQIWNEYQQDAREYRKSQGIVLLGIDIPNTSD